MFQKMNREEYGMLLAAILRSKKKPGCKIFTEQIAIDNRNILKDANKCKQWFSGAKE
jgi:hypothetical protein